MTPVRKDSEVRWCQKWGSEWFFCAPLEGSFSHDIQTLPLCGAAQVYRRHRHNAKIKPYVQNDLEGRGYNGDSLKSSIY